MADSDDKTPAQEPNKAAVPDEHARPEQSSHKQPSQDPSDEAQHRAVLVARVSTQQQGGPDKVSLGDQLEWLRGFAKRRGFQVVREFAVTVSGADGGAKHLRTIQAMARRGDLDVVCFYNPDRAFRSVLLGLQFLEEMRSREVTVFLGEQVASSDDPDVIFSTQMQLSVSDVRRQKLRRASLTKHDYVRSRGYWYQSIVPPGYKRVPDGRRIEIDVEEARLITQVFRDVADHLCSSAMHLEAATRLGLDHGALHAVVSHPVYRGVIPFGCKQHSWPAYRIVSNELWHRAQQGLHRPKPRRKRSNPMARLAKELGSARVVDLVLERGELLCKRCKHPLHRNGTRIVKNRRVPTLRCENDHYTVLVTSRDIDDLQWARSCWDCGEWRIGRFSFHHFLGLFWTLKCRTCGWRTRTRGHPFHRPERKPAGPANRRLGDFGLQL